MVLIVQIINAKQKIFLLKINFYCMHVTSKMTRLTLIYTFGMYTMLRRKMALWSEKRRKGGMFSHNFEFLPISTSVDITVKITLK